MIETTFAEETETDLFGEQAVLCGGVTELDPSRVRDARRGGLPEVAYYECLHELKLIVDLIWEGGLSGMRYSISDTAEFGDLTRGPRVIDEHVRARMRGLLDDIRSGAFAKEWIEWTPASRGSRELREQAAAQPMEQVGKELRADAARRSGGARWLAAQSTSASACSATGRSAPPSTGCSSRMRTTSSGYRAPAARRARARPGRREGAQLSRQPRRADDRPVRDPDDPSISLVAEVMGGIEPTGGYVLELLAAGKRSSRRTSSSSPSVARSSSQRPPRQACSCASRRVCAAIPVIKVLREALVVTNVHRVLGIVNGTTNFILTQMENGATLAGALAQAQRLGYAEADPTDDVSGADAAAKMAILATVAFGSRVTLDDVDRRGDRGDHSRACRSRSRARDGREVGRDGDARRRQARRPRASFAR